MQQHGIGYLSVGFAFGAGGCNAVPVDANGERGVLQPFQLPPPGENNHEGAFMEAGLEHAFLDLRNLGLNLLGSFWFSQTHALREMGTVLSPSHLLSNSATSLVSRFDLLVFFRNVSASRLLCQSEKPWSGTPAPEMKAQVSGWSVSSRSGKE